MKHRLLTSNPHAADLIVYFAGWGTPPALVTDWHRPPSCDLLLCWDYRDLTLDFDFSPYARVHLLAWSLGVWAAENSLPPLKWTSATAVNGTPRPIDEDFGIPSAIFNGTLNGLQGKFAVRTRDKFERRMTGDATRLTAYRQLPQRDLPDITAELAAVGKIAAAQTLSGASIAWQRAVIGEQDGIFPPDNQQCYWQTYVPNCHLQRIDAPHEALSQWADFTMVLDGFNT